MFYNKDNLTIYYEKYGNGKDNILILPGWGHTRNTFIYLINYLKNNYTIYIVDYPGFGNSPIPNKTLIINDYTSLINNFIKEKEISNPTIIAHSFGGRITSLLLTKYNLNINRLILIDVAGIKHHKKLNIYLKEKIYKLLKKISYLLPRKKQEKYRQKLLSIFASQDYKSIPPIMQKSFQNIIKVDLKKYYQKITQKTLILWGEKDKDTPLKDAYFLKKHLKNSELITYKNSTHYSYLDNIYLTNIIIEAFLKEKTR